MWLIQRSGNNKNNGFTIVELVVVILIIGIFSVSVIPRFFNTSSYKNRLATDELMAALRYSQQTAMNRGGDIQFILTANNFTVQRSGGGSLRSPDGRIPYSKTFPDSITASPTTINFNALGQPINDAATLISSNIPLTVGTSNITVEANTGYAH